MRRRSCATARKYWRARATSKHGVSSASSRSTCSCAHPTWRRSSRSVSRLPPRRCRPRGTRWSVVASGCARVLSRRSRRSSRSVTVSTDAAEPDTPPEIASLVTRLRDLGVERAAVSFDDWGHAEYFRVRFRDGPHDASAEVQLALSELTAHAVPAVVPPDVEYSTTEHGDLVLDAEVG